MTLTELWNDLPKLAEYLGIEYKDGIKPDYSRNYRWRASSKPMMTTKPADEVVTDALSDHCRANQREWEKSRHNHLKPLTWTQLIQEALRVEFGIKHGKLHERVALAKMMRPDLYGDDKPTPSLTWEETKKEIGMAAA